MCKLAAESALGFMGSGKKISPARFLHISSPQNTQPLVGRKVQTYDKARVGHLNTCRIVSTTDEYDRKELLLEQHYATDTRKHICDDSIALCRGCIGLAPFAVSSFVAIPCQLQCFLLHPFVQESWLFFRGCTDTFWPTQFRQIGLSLKLSRPI